MDSRNKKLKRNHRRGDNKDNNNSTATTANNNRIDFDGLSCLPDCILIYILTFLDTKTAIRTSVLAKRYKDLWTSLQSFFFKLPGALTEPDPVLFYDGYIIARSINAILRGPRVDSFESTVNNVLKRRENSDLKSFGLSLHKPMNGEFIVNVLDYVAKHNVVNLNVRGYVESKPVKFPNSFLTASKLTTLRMTNAISYCMDLPTSVDWPSLKVMYLKNFAFVDFNAELFSGCPNLESLILKKCCIKPGNNMKVLYVHGPNLRILHIRNWRSPWRFFHEQTIDVYAPKLVIFKFEGPLARMTFRDGLPCLEEARINFSCPTACSGIDLADRKPQTAEVFLGMLRALGGVKVLSLSLKAIEVLSSLPDIHLYPPYSFENLKFIRFSAEDKCKERTIPIKTFVKLLERASTCVLVVDGTKEPKISPDSASVKRKLRNATCIALPGNVMQFLLSSTPAAESLTIEAPKASSDME